MSTKNNSSKSKKNDNTIIENTCLNNQDSNHNLLNSSNLNAKKDNVLETCNGNNQQHTDNSTKYLCVKNMSKSYIGGYSGVNEISFELDACEKMVLLGDYSSGKTTILSVLAGLESITSGEMYLNGKLINNLKIKDRNIGYLDKKLQLDGTKKIKDIICYPLKIRKVDNNTIAERLASFANLFEISGLLNKKVKKLDAFQQKLVALARLFICDRDLYLIDNIFDNLQKAEISKLIKIIEKISAQKTIIYSTINYEIACMLSANKLLMLAYSTMVYFGSFHNKEIFLKTIAGYKLYKNQKICCVPADIKDNKLTIDNKEYIYSRPIISDVFDKGILLLDMDKISFDNSKNVVICEEIYYINKDNIAYLDINSFVSTIYLEGNFKVGDKINFSFNQEDGILYDFESERKISA